ncbi:MAG TPA: hypothetical protein VMV92_00630 [Streptosporangiaceae bacterium]|nr:hypothetical protein [Streptosporangiaceae bacterium]
MHSPGEKLRQAVQSAAESVRDVAGNTGRLVVAALVIAGAALLMAFVALLAVTKLRKTVTASAG